MKLQNISHIVLGLMMFSGCSSMLKKPEIEEVKKIAVLSVFANATVPDKKGRGIVAGEGWSDSLRLEIASNALQSFEENLKKMGWQVVPGNSVITSKEYMDAFRPPQAENATVNKVMGFLTDMAEQQQRKATFSPPGMYPIFLDANEVDCGRLVGIEQPRASAKSG